MAAISNQVGGLEALHRLKSTEPPLYLSPSPDLSQAARTASQHIFSSLRPFAPKSPFDRLLIDGFDAEQIWQQIDLQSQPLISGLRRELRKFEKNPEEISKQFGGVGVEKSEGLETESEDLEVMNGAEDEELEGFDEDEDDEDEEEEEEVVEEEEVEEEGKSGGLEDKFLKIKELEEYLEDDEAREYGLKKRKGYGKVSSEGEEENGEDDELEDDDDEEEEDNELGVFEDDDSDDDGGANKLGKARYEDFFGAKKKNVQKRKSKSDNESDDSDLGDEQENDKAFSDQKKENISTHEKQLGKLQSKIEQMEKANMEPKTWTMQGEVTAARRPKNSALEVDLDFEHNVRPAPVITEEVTVSIEELIQKRILEGRFDDVQKARSLPSRSPKELKELDENKSKKGLAEIYEDEYVQKTGLVSAALSFSDEQKKEASVLFKKLCLKLDALSHFHFTPKPVIEDMSIQTNVPALAMEEIAPVAVSDAAMLAPEEVFGGKGDVKEEVELTQEERKRRRANKKRKFKAEAVKRGAKKARESTLPDHINGKED
ncbi:M phase phosphoprotein 10 [Cornus florida]|uniref:M phase phosphoprotein 10 n=1 Tax=Cornus florida TaxID=4283 RepID=UPI00289BF1D6|nr:M phase phosphoprotein 10 [Cornus florida]